MDENFFINSRQDAEKYMSLPPPAADCASFPAAQREADERGIVDVSLGGNPAGVVAGLCGSENFAILSVTDRDVLHALCQRELEAALRRLKYVIERGVGPFFSMAGEEYIVPPLHGPRDFADL